MKKPTVLISSSSDNLPLAHELQRQLQNDAEILLWSDTLFQVDRPATESITEIADRCDFAVVVLSEADTSFPAEHGPLPRSNAAFELGYLAGRLGRSRTFLVSHYRKSGLLPTDLSGMPQFRVPSDRPDIAAALHPLAQSIRSAMATMSSRGDKPQGRYSCFICYSVKDEDFIRRLNDDLKMVGVRTWLDTQDIKIGDKWVEKLERAIQASDKILVVLSEASVRSSWVRAEVDHAVALERTRKSTVLFPIRIDNSVFEQRGNPAIALINDRHIGDFRNWRDGRLYQKAFSHLVRDLAISASAESGGAS